MAGSGWTLMCLGDACSKIGSGATPRGGSDVYLQDGPYALIRSQNIHNDSFHRAGLAFISRNHAAELENVEVLESDVLLNITGDSVARACQVDPAILPARVNQHVAIIRPDPKKLVPRFLRYFLISPEIQAKLLSWAGSGGTRSALTKGMIESFEVIAPRDVAEQRVIAHILGTLDDKIELNRRMSETLEAMARAIFKSWFVDFDPVRAKAEGHDPGLPKTIADLFNHQLVDTDLGEIPKGWEVGLLGDIAEHPRRPIHPKAIGSDTPYIALEHMPKRCITLSCWGISDQLKSNKFEFKRGEILFGKLRPYFHKVGVAAIDGVCSTDIVVIAPKAEPWFGFVFGHVSSDEFAKYTNAGSTGTKMPRTSWSDMARYSVVMPPEHIATAFTSWIQPSIEKIIHSIHESRTLSALRDALLPKLISGRLRVKDAEKILSEVSV